MVDEGLAPGKLFTTARVQAVSCADAARIRFGDYFRLAARRKEVQGYESGPYMHFWNVWLDK